MTLNEILLSVYDECAYDAAPPSKIQARIMRFVNEGLHAVFAEPGLSRLADSDDPLTFASVANQARYVLPESVAQIRALTERTNDLGLEAMSLSAYRRFQPDPTSSTGTPTHYVPIGKTYVATPPSDASELFVKSTSASDTQTAFVEGLITGGYRRTASVTMTGTTAVSLSSLITTFIEVEDFYLSSPAVGTVTLLEDSGVGTELARITIGTRRQRYYGLYLWPTPSAAVTYYVDYRRELVDLVNPTDEPPLPPDFHSLLADYAVLRERELQDDAQRIVVAKQRYQAKLNRLKYATQWTADELPTMGRSRVIGHSRLGGNFPADSYSRW